MIVFVGDIHSDLSRINRIINKYPFIKKVIQVGDLGLYYSKQASTKDHKEYQLRIDKIIEDKPTMLRRVDFIKGNHEDFEMLNSKLLKMLNINYIKQGSILKIGECTIGFLGGIFSPKKFESDPTLLEGRNKRFYTKSELELLNKRDDVDILVTHEGPKGLIPGKKIVGGFHIRKLVEDLKPKYHIHGHHHFDYTIDHGPTKIIGLGANEKSYKLIRC